jgi:TRAP-type C4-dicarboxylate transport system permease large subunit
MTILMEMGLIHPPVGLNIFVISEYRTGHQAQGNHVGHRALPAA